MPPKARVDRHHPDHDPCLRRTADRRSSALLHATTAEGADRLPPPGHGPHLRRTAGRRRSGLGHANAAEGHDSRLRRCIDRHRRSPVPTDAVTITDFAEETHVIK
ncbi:hypothetical protein [Nocardia sp. NPDC060259]|uniref:hypothetical protein n=1 Tax=Nocardia sp. NPDC060259 TaxID=3347088 RepID=UPI00364FD51D